MSFNPNHITPMITRNNYEEYFLLYVDNELAPEQKTAVDAFVLLHPDLKEELDLLCGTRLPDEAVSFQGKEELLADSMKVAAVEESLLLYIDNELPAWEKEAVERKLHQDESFALQHRTLLKTKLDKNEHIAYPDKKELYRRTEKRIVPYWLRIAAAVMVVAGSAAVWMTMAHTESSVSEVAAISPKDAPQKTAAATQVETAVSPNTPEQSTANKTVALKKETPAVQTNKMVAALKTTKRPVKTTTKQTFSKPHSAEENLAEVDVLVTKKATVENLQMEVAKADDPDLNKPVVTSEAAAAYVPLDAAANTTVPVQAVATTNEKSGGMKVFLRKATRFIERRTGIKTVNENDELLVGALALKL